MGDRLGVGFPLLQLTGFSNSKIAVFEATFHVLLRFVDCKVFRTVVLMESTGSCSWGLTGLVKDRIQFVLPDYCFIMG